MKRVGLGRGLDALFASDADSARPMREIPLDLLQRGRYQPRSYMDAEALAALAASIRSQGVVQPIVVRGVGGGRYEIIAGERRWRAAQMAGLAGIPAIVRECSDEQALALGLIENIQREALNPLEEAQALQRLLNEFALTHEDLAEKLGRSRAAISNQLRLLRLPQAVHRHLENGALSAGHARALLALPAEVQVAAVERVLREDLTVRATERLAREMAKAPKPAKARDPNIIALEAEIAAVLGLAATVIPRARGGELRLSWDDPEQGEALLARLGVRING
ncbi:MAG: ParB/RepB/Spo0J family partition protein [Acidithiobacillus sp.]